MLLLLLLPAPVFAAVVGTAAAVAAAAIADVIPADMPPLAGIITSFWSRFGRKRMTSGSLSFALTPLRTAPCV